MIHRVEEVLVVARFPAVEQETGTKHARDLEMSQAQARGNQDLEVTKALTKPGKEGERAPNIEAAVGYNELSDRRDNAEPPFWR